MFINLRLVNLPFKRTSKRSNVRTGAEEASMNDLATVILADLFALIALLSLVSADPVAGRGRWASLNGPGNAELELRYALHK